METWSNTIAVPSLKTTARTGHDTSITQRAKALAPEAGTRFPLFVIGGLPEWVSATASKSTAIRSAAAAHQISAALGHKRTYLSSRWTQPVAIALAQVSIPLLRASVAIAALS
jgi:hypothetical protein